MTTLSNKQLKFNSPQGYLINGKILPSVSGNNLTVAIKTLAGNDPSASDPVYIRIGDTIRSITSALSVTKNAATNWFNAGSAELATKEIDYFVYLGYNATDGVVIGFSRIPFAAQYSDFSVTTTNEKYCAISTITTAAATDYYENVGRFAATLSAGAGYTWSVTSFTAINLIQRPIFESRLLSYNPAWTATGTAPAIGNAVVNAKYKIMGSKVKVNTEQVNGSTTTYGTNEYRWSTPFTSVAIESNFKFVGSVWATDTGVAYYSGISIISDSSSSISCYTSGGSAWGQTIPFTWGNTDKIAISVEYEV